MNDEVATRIVFFLGFENPFGGAGWRRVEFFANYLRRKSYDVYVVGSFSPHNPTRTRSFQKREAKIFNICPFIAIDFWPVATLNILLSVIFLVIAFVTIKPEITVISMPRGENALGAYLASRLIGARVIFDYRDEWEDDAIRHHQTALSSLFYSLLKKVFTSLYRRGEYVISVTLPMVNNLKRRGIQKVHLVPNGADLMAFRKLEPDEKAKIRERYCFNPNDFIAVYSGLVKDTVFYQPSIMLRAVRRVADEIPEIRLLIIGPNPSSEFTDLIKQMNLSCYVRYLGLMKSARDVSGIIGICDIGIIPYTAYDITKNTVPAKFFEYCACGLPVIAMVHGDSILAKLIHDNKIGSSCAPGDVAALANTLGELGKNRESRAASGLNARMLIEKEYDRNVIVDDFLKIINSLAVKR